MKKYTHFLSETNPRVFLARRWPRETALYAAVSSDAPESSVGNSGCLHLCMGPQEFSGTLKRQSNF